MRTDKGLLWVLAISAVVMSSAHAQTVQEHFFNHITALCGQAFEGQVTTKDSADSAFSSKKLVMHVRECSDSEIKIPFHVGDDRSRTWILSKTATGLRLKHDHRHKDGSEDKVTMYGGDTVNSGLETEQSFPVDQFSIENFTDNHLNQSITNIWHIYIQPGVFSYRLTRENRDFRVDFDLSKPVSPPPAPWGYK